MLRKAITVNLQDEDTGSTPILLSSNVFFTTTNFDIVKGLVVPITGTNGSSRISVVILGREI